MTVKMEVKQKMDIFSFRSKYISLSNVNGRYARNEKKYSLRKWGNFILHILYRTARKSGVGNVAIYMKSPVKEPNL